MAFVDLLMLVVLCSRFEPISARDEARNEAPTDIRDVARSKLPVVMSSFSFLNKEKLDQFPYNNKNEFNLFFFSIGKPLEAWDIPKPLIHAESFAINKCLW